MESHHIEYEDNVYIGVSPEYQDDNVTHGDWKQDIKDRINNALPGANLTFGWFEDCSYDG